MRTKLHTLLKTLLIACLLTIVYPAIIWGSTIDNDEKIISKTIPKIGISPNPVVDITEMNVQGIPNIATIQLYNIQGRLVKEWHPSLLQNNKIDMDLSDLQSGIYVLQINEQYAQRVVKL